MLAPSVSKSDSAELTETKCIRGNMRVMQSYQHARLLPLSLKLSESSGSDGKKRISE